MLSKTLVCLHSINIPLLFVHQCDKQFLEEHMGACCAVKLFIVNYFSEHHCMLPSFFNLDKYNCKEDA